MAISRFTEFEVRTDGDQYNGAGFAPLPGATKTRTDNYTYGPSYAVFSGTNLTLDGADATLAQPDGYSPQASDIGHTIRIYNAPGGWSINGGGYYQIVDIESGKWKLDRAPGSAGASGASWKLGGAANYFALVGGVVLDALPPGRLELTPIIWVKEGTYYQTNTNQNAYGGGIHPAESLGDFHVIGYSSQRGDGGYATLETSVPSTALYSLTSVQNMRVVATFASHHSGVYAVRFVFRCMFEGFSGAGGAGCGESCYVVAFCEAVNCDIGFRYPTVMFHCVAHTCGTGFKLHTVNADITKRLCVECVAHRCTTGFGPMSTDTILPSLYRCHAVHCTTGFETGYAVPYPEKYLATWSNCSAVNCTTAISMDQHARCIICAPFYHFNCGTLKANETSANRFLAEQFVQLPFNLFPGAGSNTPYSTANYTPKFVGNLANFNHIINKTWPFGLTFFDVNVASATLNMRGGFPG